MPAYRAGNIGPYNVAKSGVVALTDTLRQELDAGKEAIGASVLCPGAVATRITESERNRTLTGASSGEPSATDEQFRADAGAIVASGLAPAEVAEMVFEAVRSNEFWILPHPDWIDVLAERVAGMRERQLVIGFGG